MTVRLLLTAPAAWRKAETTQVQSSHKVIRRETALFSGLPVCRMYSRFCSEKPKKMTYAAHLIWKLEMWRSLNSNSTTRTSNIFNRFKFDVCFKRFVVECEFMANPCRPTTTDFICTESQGARERRQTVFLNSTYHTNYTLNVQHNIYSVMCYTPY